MFKVFNFYLAFIRILGGYLILKEKILDILKCHSDSFVSGQTISDELGVTRAAIWKYINKLKEEGYSIESISKKGYKLKACPDLLTYDELKYDLKTKYIGKEIIHFDTIGSTNSKGKELAEEGHEEGTIVIAEEQTEGKGRFGRKWAAAKYKSIMFSIILKPNIDMCYVPVVTQVAAAAVGKAIETFGFQPKIKWPNDVMLRGRKLCGILTEASGELDKINYVVIGIGINVNQDLSDFPEEVLNKATSLKIESNSLIPRKVLLSRILYNFEVLYDEFRGNVEAKSSLEYCKNNSMLMNKTVEISRKKEKIIAKVVDIDKAGRLIVEYKDGRRDELVSGEVSLHTSYEL